MNRDGFTQILRGEWTKFRSVRGTMWSTIIAAGLMVVISGLFASASSTDVGQGCPCFVDQFHFVHQPMTGDGTITARVLNQQDTGLAPRAGIMIKESAAPLESYAAIGVVAGQGVRMQADFGADAEGSADAAPRWLRLTRAGDMVTGEESADGTTWRTVATLDVPMAETAQVGLYVTSPGREHVIRHSGGNTSGHLFTASTAAFDQVEVRPAEPAGSGAAEWTAEDVGGPVRSVDGTMVPGATTQAGGVFTVGGAGDIREVVPAGNDDMVMNALSGVIVAVIAVAVAGTVFMTAEYSRGTIRSTFTASPRRGRVLIAKAVVLGAATFVAGLVASVAALLIALPIMRGNGYRPPGYPDLSLTDGPVLRATVGTAALIAVLALFSLGLGT
ncbi:MAG TPA: DUF1349 domain-containing protein, partial [Actinoplanes sp.]|nr:DUF1349 domain-containing protein [Actinoplanes sp.]